MQIKDLKQSTEVCSEKKIGYRELIMKAIEGELEAFYVFSSDCSVSYASAPELLATPHDADASPDKPKTKRIIYEVLNSLLIPVPVLKKLWGNNQVSLETLLSETAPEGYVLSGYLPHSQVTIAETNVFVKPNQRAVAAEEVTADENPQKYNTALKVIGLFMRHLAEDPTYEHRGGPNRSAIRLRLLDLAEEFDIKEYGLGTADDGVLREALEHLEKERRD